MIEDVPGHRNPVIYTATLFPALLWFWATCIVPNNPLAQAKDHSQLATSM